MHLWFIALLPPPVLRERVRLLKTEMRDRYHAGHALTSPAHITLQMPFKRENDAMEGIVHGLETFAAGEIPFEVAIHGFGCFEPRVLFLNIADHRALDALNARLKKTLVHELGFSAAETGGRFHPHMTIATRDLTPEHFYEAWPVLKNRPFHAAFEVKSLFLLHHVDRKWRISREFAFGKRV
jgi:2'-5' RNA ligase